MQTKTDNRSFIPDAWIGIDVAKQTFDAGLHLPVEYGQPARDIADIPTFPFNRTEQGVKEMISWAESECREFASQNGCKAPNLRVVMEATGRYSIDLTSWITAKKPEIRPVIEDPGATHKYAQSLKVQNKTDPIDARVLARYGAERMPEPRAEVPAHYTELREKSRLRENLVNDLTAARERFKESSNNKVCADIQKKLIRQLEKAVEEIDEAIREQVDKNADLKHVVELMTTIPGVGFKTAVVVLAECGPLDYFKRSRSLASYAGLAPKRKESGTSVQGGTRITRRGPAVLRQKLYMASISAGQKIDTMQQLKDRMTEKGKPPMSARCAVMRKLLVLMRAVVVNDTPFIADYNHKNFSLNKG